MGMPRARRALLAAVGAVLSAGLVAALVLVFSGDSRAEPTRAQYLARVATICRAYGPRLDKVRPPDVSEPANVIAAVTVVLPLIEAQESEVRRLRAPSELRTDLARWFALQDRRIAILQNVLREGRRQDFRAMSIAYVDFTLAGPEAARLGRSIGFPQPPC